MSIEVPNSYNDVVKAAKEHAGQVREGMEKLEQESNPEKQGEIRERLSEQERNMVLQFSTAKQAELAEQIAAEEVKPPRYEMA